MSLCTSLITSGWIWWSRATGHMDWFERTSSKQVDTAIRVFQPNCAENRDSQTTREHPLRKILVFIILLGLTMMIHSKIAFASLCTFLSNPTHMARDAYQARSQKSTPSFAAYFACRIRGVRIGDRRLIAPRSIVRTVLPVVPLCLFLSPHGRPRAS